MKNFMKAIAFATVMCMVLSTVAFAAVDVTNYAEKKVTVTVENVTQGEQVAIVITNGVADEYSFTTGTILYVDQKAAESTSVVFEDIVISDSVDTIDVYAGYASNSGDKAFKVVEDEPLTQDTKLTLLAAQFIDDITEADDYEEVMGDRTVNAGQKASLAWVKLNAVNVAAGGITEMVWAFKVIKDGESEVKTKYVAGDISKLGLGSVLRGPVQIAAAFDSAGYTLTGGFVKFKLNGKAIELGNE